MNFRPRQRDEVGLDLTPLIDVVFLLLLFFMLTTTFVETARLEVDLPEAEQGRRSEHGAEPWVIEIDARGHYALNGEPVPEDRLALRLHALAKSGDVRDVLIRADGRASHQAVVRVLDAARGAGLVRVGLATERPPSTR